MPRSTRSGRQYPGSARCRLAVGQCLLASLFAPTCLAQTELPLLTVRWTIDGGTEESTEIAGQPNSIGGVQYNFNLISAEGTFLISYIGNADFIPDPQTNLNGILTIKNISPSPREIDLALEVPVCPTISGGSAYGFIVVMTLTTNGPGFASCIQDGIFGVSADSSILKWVFPCPAMLQTSGSGTITSTANWGTPGTSAAGPFALAAKGVRTRFLLSDDDQLGLTFSYNAKATNQFLESDCAADFNGDAAVDAVDLSILLGAWGTQAMSASFCFGTDLPGDANGDGSVDAADLAILLGAWGACPK